MHKMTRTRKFRRSMAAIHKRKAWRKAMQSRHVPDTHPPTEPSDREVGMLARTPCPCSCWLCTGYTGREQRRMRADFLELCTRTLAEYELQQLRHRVSWRRSIQ